MIFLHIHLNQLFFHQVAVGVGFFDRIEVDLVVCAGDGDDAVAAPAVLIVGQFGAEVIHQHVGGGFLKPLGDRSGIAEGAEPDAAFWINVVGFVVIQALLQSIFLSWPSVRTMVPADAWFCAASCTTTVL